MRLLGLYFVVVLFVVLLADAYGKPSVAENVEVFEEINQPVSLSDVARQGHENVGDRLARGYYGGGHRGGHHGGHWGGHHGGHGGGHHDGHWGGGHYGGHRGGHYG